MGRHKAFYYMFFRVLMFLTKQRRAVHLWFGFQKRVPGTIVLFKF
jgi:hypothetical protein